MIELILVLALCHIVNMIYLTPEMFIKELQFPPHLTQELGNNKYPELTSRLTEGDILVPAGKSGRNAVRLENYLWPSGVVPYAFDNSYTAEEASRVEAAMRRIESKTCVHFVRFNNQRDFIRIMKEPGKGCYAMIGYHGNGGGPHPVNFQSPACLEYRGTIEHELLHVLGLLHEQARPDRDNYVNILWDNIDKAYWEDFNKASPADVTTYDIPYDHRSVMHYPRFAFSKNGKDTIINKKVPTMELGQRTGATNGDLEKIRRMYKCGRSPN